MTRAATVSLPADLAPTLRDNAVALLEQVGLAPAHPDPREGGGPEHRCTVCHRGGKLAGHDLRAGVVVWVHHKCRRRIHRAGTPRRVLA